MKRSGDISHAEIDLGEAAPDSFVFFYDDWFNFIDSICMSRVKGPPNINQPFVIFAIRRGDGHKLRTTRNTPWTLK
jgi:hypothetical protein